jgi:hypothetical protein
MMPEAAHVNSLVIYRLTKMVTFQGNNIRDAQ